MAYILKKHYQKSTKNTAPEQKTKSNTDVACGRVLDRQPVMIATQINAVR
jgi:hypothetical protein